DEHGAREQAQPGGGQRGQQRCGEGDEREGHHRGGGLGAGDGYLLEVAGEVRCTRGEPDGTGAAGEGCGRGDAEEHDGAPCGHARTRTCTGSLQGLCLQGRCFRRLCAGGNLRGLAHAGRSVSAAAAARRAAAALAWLSRCSIVASESATTPPPAWTCAVPSLSTAVRIAIAMSMSPAKSM